MKEIEDKVEQFLKYYNISTNSLHKVLERHFEGKKKIFEIIGLNKKNDWRVSVPLPVVYEGNSIVSQFINEMTQITGKYTSIDGSAEYMMDGKDKVRIGKVINYYLKNFYFSLVKLVTNYREEYEKMKDVRCCEVLKDNLLNTYIMFNEAKLVFEKKDLDDESKIDAMVAKFSCFFGDYTKSQRNGIISGNPLDYFTLSGIGTTFASCICIDGEHFNSVLHYIGSPNTIVSYTVDGKIKTSSSNSNDVAQEFKSWIPKKIGRALFYINRGLIISSRYYGSYYQAENDAFILYLKEKLGGGFTEVPANIQKENSYFQNLNTSAYLDFGYMKTFVQGSFDKIVFQSGLCLKCGGNIGKADLKGICDECFNGERKCYLCGKTHATCYLDRYNQYVCEECYNKNVECSYCNQRINKEDIRIVINRSGERNWCRWCAEDHSRYCEDCGKLFHRDMLSNYKCPECTKKRVEKARCEKELAKERIPIPKVLKKKIIEEEEEP